MRPTGDSAKPATLPNWTGKGGKIIRGREVHEFTSYIREGIESKSSRRQGNIVEEDLWERFMRKFRKRSQAARPRGRGVKLNQGKAAAANEWTLPDFILVKFLPVSLALFFVFPLRWSKNRKGAQQLDLVYWEIRDRQYRLSAREGAKRTDPERKFISLVALRSSIRFQGRREDIVQPELERKQEHQGPVQESASVKEENPTV
ncbi:hypothetical protein SDJN03_06956, partial [Cucurbita argyrosperma subsp. sororia]